jgi:hypothetical protein
VNGIVVMTKIAKWAAIFRFARERNLREKTEILQESRGGDAPPWPSFVAA